VSAATLSPPDFALGKRFVEIALGIDAYERSGAPGASVLDGEGLVPIFMARDRFTPQPFASWPEAFAALDELEGDAAAVPPGTRRDFLTSFARSLRAAARIFAGEAMSFEEKLRDLVGVPDALVPDDAIEAIHSTLDGLIAKRGFTQGTLRDRVTAWERSRILTREGIVREFEHLMAEAKRRTDERIFPTGDYTMALRPLEGVPYTARCAFEDGCMDINLDVAFTRSSLKHLVCHEVFPGHSTQLLSTFDAYERGTTAADALLCTTNGATGAVQEGIGDQGIELIDFVEDEDDAAHIELRRLQTACGTNAAFHLNVSGWNAEACAAYLRDVAFAQDAWIRGRLAMAVHPFRGAFVASYWFGNEAVRETRLRAGSAHAAEFVSYLYSELHTPATLRSFVA
jgi:hypothetical protein